MGVSEAAAASSGAPTTAPALGDAAGWLVDAPPADRATTSAVRPGVGAACAAHASSPEGGMVSVSEPPSLRRFVPAATGTGAGANAPSAGAALDDAMLAHARRANVSAVELWCERAAGAKKIPPTLARIRENRARLFSLWRVTAHYCVDMCSTRSRARAGHRVARRVAFGPCDAPRDLAGLERPFPSP